MKKQENITKRGPLIWSDYEHRLDHLDILFRFIHYAFRSLSEEKRKGFVKGLKQEAGAASAEKLKMVESWLAKGLVSPEVFDESLMQDVQQRWQKKTKAKYRSRNHTQYAEWVTDGMISTEILFRVTVFENFLKHVHANLLKDDMSILARAKPKRQTTYEELFSVPFEQFRQKLICCEVEDLDRQGMEQRLDYFAKHLGIDFKQARERLIEISEIRNSIAHGQPLNALTKEETTMPLPDIQGSITKAIKEAMKFAFDEARKKRPQHFLP